MKFLLLIGVIHILAINCLADKLTKGNYVQDLELLEISEIIAFPQNDKIQDYTYDYSIPGCLIEYFTTNNEQKNGATVTLTSGGLGTDNMVLQYKSTPGKGYHFHLFVYGYENATETHQVTSELSSEVTTKAPKQVPQPHHPDSELDLVCKKREPFNSNNELGLACHEHEGPDSDYDYYDSEKLRLLCKQNLGDYDYTFSEETTKKTTTTKRRTLPPKATTKESSEESTRKKPSKTTRKRTKRPKPEKTTASTTSEPIDNTCTFSWCNPTKKRPTRKPPIRKPRKHRERF